MRLSRKTIYCRRAENDLRGVLLDWLERHKEITWAEAVQCLAGLIYSWSSYPVIEERETKGMK